LVGSDDEGCRFEEVALLKQGHHVNITVIEQKIYTLLFSLGMIKAVLW
jgi:hypothetical protein